MGGKPGASSPPTFWASLEALLEPVTGQRKERSWIFGIAVAQDDEGKGTSQSSISFE
jgi:hypothetical protein